MSACYQCQGPASGACTQCGRLYCAQHGHKTAGDGFFIRARHGLCDACHAEMGPRAAIAAWVMVLVLVGGLVAILIGVAMSH